MIKCVSLIQITDIGSVFQYFIIEFNESKITF